MKRAVLAVVLGVIISFLAGFIAGRQTMTRREFSLPRNPLSLGNRPAKVHSSDSQPVSLSGAEAAESTGPLTTEALIAKLKAAMMQPSDRRGYLEASRLIDSLDPSQIRPILDSPR